MAVKFGEDQVKIWRRSYDVPPPPLELDDFRHPRFDRRYSELSQAQLPATESLKITLERRPPILAQHPGSNDQIGQTGDNFSTREQHQGDGQILE